MSDQFPRVLHRLVMAKEHARPIAAHRPGLLLHHRAFCVLMRVFLNKPYPDVCFHLKHWEREYLLPYAPEVNTLCTYMKDPLLADYFEELSHVVARRVRRLERAVVVDSSSISTIWSANYLDTNRGKKVIRSRNRWLKPHVAAGPVTTVVSAIYLTWNKRGNPNDRNDVTADVNFFIPLIERSLTRGWDIKVVAGDKGYYDEENYTEPKRRFGIDVFVPFKRNVNIDGKSDEMTEIFEMYMDESSDEFELIYNSIRPKIEGVFSAVKRTTGPYLWSRGALLPENPTPEQLTTIGASRRNEMLAKFLVHSIRQLVVLEQMHEEQVRFDVPDWAFDPFKDEALILEDTRHVVFDAPSDVVVHDDDDDENTVDDGDETSP